MLLQELRSLDVEKIGQEYIENIKGHKDKLNNLLDGIKYVPPRF